MNIFNDRRAQTKLIQISRADLFTLPHRKCFMLVIASVQLKSFQEVGFAVTYKAVGQNSLDGAGDVIWWGETSCLRLRELICTAEDTFV